MKLDHINKFSNVFHSALLIALVAAAPLCAHPLVMATQDGDDALNSEQFLAENELAKADSNESGTGSGSGGVVSLNSHKSFALSDAQLEKILEYKDQFEVSTAGKKAERHSLMRKIESLMNQPILVDKKEILQINDKVSSLNAELSNAYMTYLLSVNGELTAEQRKQLRHAMLVRVVAHGPFPPHFGGPHSPFGPPPFMFGGFGGPPPFGPPGFGPPPPFGPASPFGPPPFGPHHFGANLMPGCPHDEPGNLEKQHGGKSSD